MNERIKELALQAGLQQRVWNSLGKELPMWQEDPDNPGLEKFAELLVLECINTVIDGTREGDHYAMRIEHHFDNGPGGILHFGVEE